MTLIAYFLDGHEFLIKTPPVAKVPPMPRPAVPQQPRPIARGSA